MHRCLWCNIVVNSACRSGFCKGGQTKFVECYGGCSPWPGNGWQMSMICMGEMIFKEGQTMAQKQIMSRIELYRTRSYRFLNCKMNNEQLCHHWKLLLLTIRNMRAELVMNFSIVCVFRLLVFNELIFILLYILLCITVCACMSALVACLTLINCDKTRLLCSVPSIFYNTNISSLDLDI